MAKATGIGGVFFRSRDTKALADWYATHLGVTNLWPQESGLTVFAPFEQDTGYFSSDKQWMINFRVDSLDGITGQLRAAGIAVETRPEEWDTAEIGRFCRIQDPEGNQIELWEPPTSVPG